MSKSIKTTNTEIKVDLSKAVGERYQTLTGKNEGIPLFMNNEELERAEKIVQTLSGMSIESAQELLIKVNTALLQLIFIS